MGGGASKKLPVKVEIDVDEVLAIANDENVELCTIRGLKTSFPQGNGVALTAEIMKAAEDSWLEIFENRMERFKKEMQVNRSIKKETSALEWFVQKFYARISEIDRNAYGIYPCELKEQVRIVGSMVHGVLRIGSEMLNESGVVCELKSVKHVTANISDGERAAKKILSAKSVSFQTAKSHYQMGVNSKEYRLMGSAFIDTLKYAYGKQNPQSVPEIVRLWHCVFTHVLQDVMKCARAMEMLYSPEALSGSRQGSHGSHVTSSVLDGAVSYHGSINFADEGESGSSKGVMFLGDPPVSTKIPDTSGV